MSNSKPLEPPGTLFLDRTHQSNIALKLLRALGCSIERHKTHFLPEAPDDEWIPVCAAKDWIIISGDKGIIRDGFNRAAVEKSKAKVFLLADTDAKGADWAASLAVAARKILRLATSNEGPFYCKVSRASDTHVGKVEYLPGGGPVPVAAVLEPTISVFDTPIAEHAKKDEDPFPLQPKLDFTGS